MAPRKKTDKESVQKAAARAERRAKTAAKQDTIKPPASPTIANDTEEQNRALFLHHLTHEKQGIKVLIDAQKQATANLRNAYKKAKADGFLKADFDIALDIQKADGEKRRKELIQRNLQIAAWLGCDLGAQLDLFARMVETGVPAEDRAYEEGKTASYAGQSANPPYDPSLAQHRRWLEGWHDATATRVESGISKLHPEVQKDEADKAAKKAQRKAEQDKDAAAFDAPSSGVAMTREEYKRQQATRDGQGDLAVN